MIYIVVTSNATLFASLETLKHFILFRLSLVGLYLVYNFPFAHLYLFVFHWLYFAFWSLLAAFEGHELINYSFMASFSHSLLLMDKIWEEDEFTREFSKVYITCFRRAPYYVLFLPSSTHAHINRHYLSGTK